MGPRRYRFTLLDRSPYGGDDWGEVFSVALNDRGQVAWADDTQVWFRPGRNTAPRPLFAADAGPGGYPFVSGLNNAGVITGWFRVWENGAILVRRDYGFVWAAGRFRFSGHPRLLARDEQVRVTRYTHVRAVNGRGRFVGDAVQTAGFDGETTDDASRTGVETGINDAGLVVGYREETRRGNGVLYSYAILWEAAGRSPVRIGPPGGGNSAANAVSAAGRIVGYAAPERDQPYRAVVWDPPRRRMRWLDTLPGCTLGEATSVNERGEVVGRCCVLPRGAGTTPTVSRACLWLPDASPAPLDLNALTPGRGGWTLTDAAQGNARGEVVGTCRRGGETGVYLLTLSDR
jgi:hypothetical protein